MRRTLGLILLLLITSSGCRTLRNFDTILNNQSNVSYVYTTENDLDTHAKILREATSQFFKSIKAKSTTDTWKNSLRWGSCSWNKIDTCQINYILPGEIFGPIFVRIEMGHLALSELETTLLDPNNTAASYVTPEYRENYPTLNHYITGICIYSEHVTKFEDPEITKELENLLIDKCKNEVIFEYFMALQNSLKAYYGSKK